MIDRHRFRIRRLSYTNFDHSSEFIRRWSNAQFVEYVGELLCLCEQSPHADQQAQFNEVLRHERDFWRMTWGNLE